MIYLARLSCRARLYRFDLISGRLSSEIVFPLERASGATPDPFDEMVLECALAADANAIVSGDKRHLLVLEEFRGIPILSPGDFLRYHKRSSD